MKPAPFPRLLATLALLTAATAPLAVSSPARAQEAAVAEHRLQGSFSYVAAGSDSIDKSIEKTVADLNFIVAPIAKSRLTKTNSIYRKVTFEFSGNQVSIVTGNRAPIKTGLNGAPIKWTREDGEVLDYSTTLAGDTIRQKFVAKDGQRVNEYTPSADGQGLTMKVTVSSPKLKEPLIYRLAYKKGA